VKLLLAECESCGVPLYGPDRLTTLDDLGGFAYQLTRELGIDSSEITTTDIARALTRAAGWVIDDESFCPRCVIATLSATQRKERW